jgi:hypothetical protein
MLDGQLLIADDDEISEATKEIDNPPKQAQDQDNNIKNLVDDLVSTNKTNSKSCNLM